MKNIILASLFVVLTNPVFAQIKGKVIGVSDGDTFTLLTENKKLRKIRFYGVDSPEKGQDYSAKTKQATTNLIIGKYVVVEEKGITPDSCILGIVTYNDTIIINELLLLNGIGWHAKNYDNSEYYVRIEQTARKNKVGLWINPLAIAPWDYKEGNRYITSSGETKVKEKANTVFICNSKNAVAYHSYICRGASNCRSGISEVNIEEAKKKGLRPCKNCY